MTISGRRKTIAFFVTLCVCLVALAIALNVGWVLNWRTLGTVILEIIFSALLIAGLILNTTFLVREIRRNEQHDAFINAVTHELKTPIASMRLYLQTLQSRELEEAKRQEFYRVMMADSDRLLQTVEQVLRAGRAGQRQRMRSPVDVVEIVQECLTLTQIRHHLPENTLHFTPAEPAIVLGDFDELQAAVLNLMDNAVKYSGSEVNVRIEVTKPDTHHVLIRVNDRGIGIPADQLSRIFRRFYRIPDSMAMRIKGTGLGLFIVRSVAEKHGGKAFAESAGRGQGSTFTLQLPLAPALPPRTS